MHQSILMYTHIYKSPEIGHICDNTVHNHPFVQILDLIHAVREGKKCETVPGIPARIPQFPDDILQCG